MNVTIDVQCYLLLEIKTEVSTISFAEKISFKKIKYFKINVHLIDNVCLHSRKLCKCVQKLIAQEQLKTFTIIILIYCTKTTISSPQHCDIKH